ncbi:aspartate/glutamate racemase family protein [Alkalimarinus coralli]|uniref:aspartate/glutamate racemase family protein n=1 Tax=Alkalimarinus coralli TaxID=2935863 RepID=UPI00202B58C2|nr:aspartate/glutamate racemase family protein [Alkalimarinus coralli]
MPKDTIENKKKIKVIIPIVPTQVIDEVKQEVEQVLAPDFSADYINVKSGTCFIESRYAEFLNTADIIKLSQQAEKDGFDAIFIDCFGSPGVSVVRELVDIPVLGGFDGAVLMAMSIAQRFSIITVVPSVDSMLESQARDLGITGNLASIRNVNIPVKDLSDKTKLIKHLLEQSKQAITSDGAEAIVLGCTGMLDVVTAVADGLKEMKLPAPVIDPTFAAICTLQSLVRCGLSQSRLTYYRSDAKLVTDPGQCSL